MNKKDREHIGYLLSDSHSLANFRERLFDEYNGIKEEYEGFESVAGRDEDVNKIAEKLMVERNGDIWPLLKPQNLKCTYRQCLEEARQEIYGDDYHPSLFK